VPPAPPADQRLPRRTTLRKSADYQTCYRAGRRRHGPLFTLHFQPNTLGAPRLGITASRRVGGAVVRTRLKRWTRECYRRSPLRGALPALDLVVHLKPESAAASFARFSAELERVLTEVVPRGAA
jgi:ribonuclease P protein component